METGQEPALLELRHDIPHGGRGKTESAVTRHLPRSDRLARADIQLDNGTENGQRSLAQFHQILPIDLGLNRSIAQEMKSISFTVN
jgi:hypothetical protein